METKPWGKPTTWYSMLGGVFILTQFLTIPAFNVLGVQIVMLATLLGMLFTGMALDWHDGALKANDCRKYFGVLIVMAGVILDIFGPSIFGASKHSSSDHCFSSSSLLYVGASFGVGVGYALMSKANAQLAIDLGSAQRATVMCAIVATLARAPLMAWCWIHGHPPYLSISDWPYWLAAAVQSALFNCSLAVLPSLLGYTANMIVMLIGKMVFSTAIDAAGWAGQTVPLDAVRAISVLIVLVGNVMFAVQSWRQLLKNGPEGASSGDSEGSHSDSGDEKRGAGSEETDREDACKWGAQPVLPSMARHRDISRRESAARPR